ncbi:hypothetical protein DQ04_00431170 [Trypanosoma grayi]|uniref:hypothetical protein n=1 Tax=Trypanosoma grayi TaxID=71804 RepID=UPI0004F44FD7|nr:hypothetical protein DQ04_00431170 [Trypanosoma grayi]KEG14513.1 hypothetical protein DQ04_00431170 [Trypanosoma grayi]
MKKLMLDSKATLGLVSDKTVDDDYSRVNASLKAFNETHNAYNNSMNKTRHAMKEVVRSLEDASKAFEKLADNTNAPKEVKLFATEFRVAAQKIGNEVFTRYVESMEKDVNKAGGTTNADYTECVHLEQQRNKAVNEYDVYRSAVSKKEDEYAKKGKNLSDSKSYNEEVRQRDEWKIKYEVADASLKEKYAALEAKSTTNNVASVTEFIGCTNTFLLELSEEMKHLQKMSSNLDA